MLVRMEMLAVGNDSGFGTIWSEQLTFTRFVTVQLCHTLNGGFEHEETLTGTASAEGLLVCAGVKHWYDGFSSAYTSITISESAMARMRLGSVRYLTGAHRNGAG